MAWFNLVAWIFWIPTLCFWVEDKVCHAPSTPAGRAQAGHKAGRGKTMCFWGELSEKRPFSAKVGAAFVGFQERDSYYILGLDDPNASEAEAYGLRSIVLLKKNKTISRETRGTEENPRGNIIIPNVMKGVNFDTLFQVKKAYRSLARKEHPDKVRVSVQADKELLEFAKGFPRAAGWHWQQEALPSNSTSILFNSETEARSVLHPLCRH